VCNTQLARAAAAWQTVARRTADAAMERDWPWRGLTADVRWAFYRTYEDLLALSDAIVSTRHAARRPASEAQRDLARYQVAYRELESLLLRAEPADFDRAPAPGDWPLRDLLGHVMKAEVGFLTVTAWALDRHRLKDDAPLKAPAEAFSGSPEADASGTVAEVLARFAALHERILHTLSGAADAELNAPVSFWYEADVRFQLHRFDAHLREHTIQAEKVLEAVLPPPKDGWRTLRLLYRALGEVEGSALGAEDLADPLIAPVADAAHQRARELLALADGSG